MSWDKVSKSQRIRQWEKADRVLADSWSGRFALCILTAGWHRAYIPGMESSTFYTLRDKEKSTEKK